MKLIEGLKGNKFCLKAYYRDYLSMYKMQYHFHPYLEIMYVEAGSCDVYVMDANKNTKKIALKKNNAIVVDNIYHKLNIDKTHAKMANLEIAYDSNEHNFPFLGLIAEIPNLLSVLKKYGYFKFIDSNNLIDLIIKIQDEQKKLMAKNISSDFYSSVLLCELLLLLERNSVSSLDYEGLYIKKAKQFIRENYMNELSVKTVADFLNISESYFFKIFKREMGVSVMDYINKVRITNAIPMILLKKLSLIDIAAEVGFQSRQSFFYNFKKITQKSPREYVAENRNDYGWATYSDYEADYIDET